MVVTGVALLLAGPSYPWYALLLVALVALSGRWEWLPAAAAGYLPYLVGALSLQRRADQEAASYGAAAVLVLLLTILRRLTRA